LVCDIHCQLGYEYQNVSGQCCGRCVQTSCVVMLPDNTTHTVQPGSIWAPPQQPCIKYECVNILDQFMTVAAKTVCPVFHPEDCTPDTETLSPDGCCRTCTYQPNQCKVVNTPTYLEENGCSSIELVNTTACSGACKTYSTYNTRAHNMWHSCSCCREMVLGQKEVQMLCPNGSTVYHSYTFIKKCGCQPMECNHAGAATGSPEAGGHAIQAKRRRR